MKRFGKPMVVATVCSHDCNDWVHVYRPQSSNSSWNRPTTDGLIAMIPISVTTDGLNAGDPCIGLPICSILSNASNGISKGPSALSGLANMALKFANLTRSHVPSFRIIL